MREAIAIVGIGCRFPGNVERPEDLATLLLEKRSAICDVPKDRWDADAFFHSDFRKPGYIHVRRHGMLAAVDRFDAAFFGISPNEAKRMDPQQRLVLETSYQAIEDAGVPLERLAGRSVACIIGAGTVDYGGMLRTPTERANIGPTSNPGSALSIVSNRVSYLFDLRGPSFTVDTACSSSLTALHYACGSIWSGAAEAAIAGGVGLIISPELTMGFSKGGYLSPDAECRAFSDHANGYVRSEGVGAVFLKPLSKALADGDRIYSLIRGTWINQDGRTQGMTVPSLDAQEDLLRSALREASVEPRQIAYLEAHGTGTPAGDPIEANAIGNVVGRASGRSDVCYLGSVKSNLGHMECAAGMGGLIKLALVLQQRRVFPNIHFRKPNPKIDLERLGLAIATDDCVPLAKEGSLFGGVNSFGFGGANGHAVLESPPPHRDRSTKTQLAVPAGLTPAPEPFLVSARSAAALKKSAGALAERVRTGDASVADWSKALLARRSRFEFRVGFAASTQAELVSTLDGLATADEAPAHVVSGRAAEGRAAPVAFVYTGQGAQWFAMGRGLLETSATFRRVVEQIGGELARFGWQNGQAGALLAELLRSRDESRVGETRVAQPCIFAVQVGLTELLAERGIVPGAVVGHSIGELAAAVAARALTVDEATRIVHWRSECQASAEGKGAMVAVGLTAAQARELLAGRTDIAIAAFNGPAALTLAGTHDAVRSVIATLEAKGTFVKKLDVSVPFHCHLMDPIEAEFRRHLGQVTSSAPAIPFYSTVTGDVSRAPLDVDYWYANIREPVRYDDALRAMLKSGFGCFVEVGPHPALMHGSRDTMRAAGARAAWVPTLRRDGDDAKDLALAVASALVHGVRETDPPASEHMSLPPHPFERERYWLETEAGRRARTLPVSHVHPHLGRFTRSTHSPEIFSVEILLDASVEPYLADHRAQGHIVVPAVGQLELVMAAARHVLGDEVNVLEDIELKRPIVLSADESDAAKIRLDVYSDDGSFVIVSNSGKPDAPWIEHTRGQVRRCRAAEPPRVDVAAVRARAPVDVAQADFYRDCESVGLELGPAFKNLVEFRRDEARTEVVCAVEPVGVSVEDAGRFLLHPALLDASVHSLLAGESGRQRLHLPFRLDRIRLFGPPPRGRFWSRARILWAKNDEICGEAELCDADGRVFARFEGLVMRLVRGSSTEHAAAAVLSAHEWRDKPLAPRAAEPSRAGQTWIVLASARVPSAAREIERRLVRSGARVVRAFAGERFAQREPHLFDVRPTAREDFEELAAAIGAPIAGIAHLWSLDLLPNARPLDAARRGAIPAGHLVSTLAARDLWAKDAEAWLVTAAATTEQPGAATLWGFGRVLMTEQSRLAVTLVDLASLSPTELEALANEVDSGHDDAEVGLRECRRLVRTLVRRDRHAGERPLDLARHAVRAVTRAQGALDSIALEEFHPREPGAGEVEIAVRAVGLNFRDVVAAMNLLTKDAWKGGLINGQQLGLDAAGVVTRVGEGVAELKVGDEIVGFFPHSLGSRATTKARLCAKLLPGISMVEAAALPTPFGTCDFALNDLAHLTRGETILVHAAAGGVGTIAVQLALSMGARVIATTSSDEKRAFLRGLGVEHIFGSRTTEFGDEIMALTRGEGVDVVLNSLSGRAMSESMRVLAPFGRFIEIGKTDIYRNRQIGLRQFGENKSYFCLDFNRVHSYPKVNIPDGLARSMQARKSGVIHTLPIRTYPLEQAGAALRHLAQGKQIGRLVVESPERGEVSAFPSTELRLDRAASYVVTGGCSGFGLALAEWLADKGASRLVLVGRRGIPSADEMRKVEDLRSRNVEVLVLRADVSVRKEVLDVIAHAERLGRIGGVFHAAMVLDDGAIDAMTEERIARVLAPKAEGAIHLHEATKDLGLDHFVLFSSIASVLGTPGQSSYAAANAVLDELAAMRRRAGLPATSVNWGVIGDVGVVARADAAQKRKILNQGVRAMTASRALSLLEHVLHEGHTQTMVADVDPRTLSRLGGAARRFDEALLSGGAARDRAESLRETLRSAPEEGRLEILVGALSRLVEGVAGLAKGQLDPDASLGRYGFDSMMVAQLQTWIDEQLSLSVAMVRLLRGPSIHELATELLAQLSGAATRAENGATLFRELRRAKDPRYRVVCFPPMAVDADAFATLAEAAPPDVSVHAMALPTFVDDDARVLEEAPEKQMAMLVDEIAALGPAPVVLYGHSMGAYFALAVARAMASRGDTKPALVVLGAAPVTDVPAALAKAVAHTPADVTDVMAAQALERFNGGALAVPAAERARMIELARRDLWLTVRGKEPDATVPPTQRALLVAGEGDILATLDKLPAAARAAAGYGDTHTVPGGHLFLLDREGCRRTLALVGEQMADLLGENPAA